MTSTILDLNLLTTKELGTNTLDESSWENLASQLKKSLVENRYVYLINTGIAKKSVSAVFDKCAEFFSLPAKCKFVYQKPKEIVSYHGYSAKYDSSGKHLIREYFHSWDRNAKYPDSEVTGFKNSIDEMTTECQYLINILFKLLAKCLELDDETHLQKCHQGLSDPEIKNFSYFSSMLYPSLPTGVDLGSSARCSTHIDCSTFTLLFQNSVGGLQGQDPNGNWLDIKPINDAVLFIPGEFLEVASGGLFKSLVHRVPTPAEPQLKQCSRQSIPYYILPDNNTLFQQIKSREENGPAVTFGSHYENLIKDRYFSS